MSHFPLALKMSTLAVSLFFASFAKPEAFLVLPILPKLELELFDPAIREHVQRAYEKLRLNPKDAQANGRLGMVLHAHRQYETAAVCYRRARLLEPQSFQWIYYLGVIQAELGKEAKAIATFREAVQLRSDYFPARLKLAESLLAEGKSQDSRQMCEMLVEQNPTSPLAHYLLGRANLAIGDLAGAAEHYQRACSLLPGFGASHYALALVYRNFGESAKSQKHFSLYQSNREGRPNVKDPLLKAIDTLRVGAQYHLERGLKLQAIGKTKQAIGQYERALRADPNRVQAHVNLLSAYLILGKWEEAEKHYHAAVEMNSNLAEAHYNYGLLLSKKGEHLQAAKAFRKALEINPFYAEAHNNLGYLLFSEGRLEEAEQQFRLAIQNKAHYRFAYYNLARALLKQEKPDKAIPHLIKAVSVEDEQTPLFMYTLADAYAKAGLLGKAIDSAHRASRLAKSFGQSALAARIDRELKQIQHVGTSP